MKYFAFSMYDSTARVYGPPFYMASPALAVREFAYAANLVGSRIANHASDFTLFQLGCFDDETGEFTADVPQINLGLAASFKKEQNHASE